MKIFDIISREVSENFVNFSSSPPEDEAVKQQSQNNLKTILKDRKETIQPEVLELEKLALTLGYNTALATFPGMCTWCAAKDYSGVNCAGANRPCYYPNLRGPCLMGFGVRMDKILEKIGSQLQKFLMMIRLRCHIR